MGGGSGERGGGVLLAERGRLSRLASDGDGERIWKRGIRRPSRPTTCPARLPTIGDDWSRAWRDLPALLMLRAPGEAGPPSDAADELGSIVSGVTDLFSGLASGVSGMFDWGPDSDDENGLPHKERAKQAAAGGKEVQKKFEEDTHSKVEKKFGVHIKKGKCCTLMNGPDAELLLDL